MGALVGLDVVEACFPPRLMVLPSATHRVVYQTGRKGRGKVTQRARTRAEGRGDRKQVTMFGARKIRGGRHPLMVTHALG